MTVFVSGLQSLSRSGGPMSLNLKVIKCKPFEFGFESDLSARATICVAVYTDASVLCVLIVFLSDV